MKLFVMRHGNAEDQADSGMDGDRALTPAGRERVRGVAKALVDVGEEPLTIVTSPLVRAVQTAEVVALVTKLGERGGTVSARREVAPGGGSEPLVRQFAAHGAKRVMFVDHEPDLSGLVSELLGSFDRPFDKAMVVGLHLAAEGGRARLRFVLEPKTLRLDPDARNES
jgi:phosphohistidine phosphatase